MQKINKYMLMDRDGFVSEGTIKELAKDTGLSETTLRFYLTPAYKKRCETYNKPRKDHYLIKIDDDDNDEDELEDTYVKLY